MKSTAKGKANRHDSRQHLATWTMMMSGLGFGKSLWPKQGGAKASRILRVGAEQPNLIPIERQALEALRDR